MIFFINSLFWQTPRLNRVKVYKLKYLVHEDHIKDLGKTILSLSLFCFVVSFGMAGFPLEGATTLARSGKRNSM